MCHVMRSTSKYEFIQGKHTERLKNLVASRSNPLMQGLLKHQRRFPYSNLFKFANLFNKEDIDCAPHFCRCSSLQR